MKQFRKIAFAALCILGAAGSFAQKIPLATGEWAPYTGAKLAGQGLATEIVTAAAKAGGVNFEFVFYGDAWLRCENEAKIGTVFATFPYSKTAERGKVYDFSEPIISGKSKIYYVEGKGKDIAWTTMKDFSAYKFIGMTSYDYVPVFKEYGIKMDPAPTSELAFKMLQAGRGDYIIEDELVAMAVIKSVFGTDAGQVKMIKKSWKEDPYFLMVSKNYPNAKEILAKFNVGLAAIKKDGAYKAILAKYGLSE